MEMITAKRLAAGVAIGVIAVAALAPSIAINVAHAMNGGGGIPMLTLAVMSVLAAPLCLMAMPRLRAEGRFDILAGAVVLFVLSLMFNMTNAVGLAGGARDHAREDRQGQMAKVAWAEQRLAQVEGDLRPARAIAGTATPEMIDAELMGLRGDPIYARSKACASVTLPDSKAHCGKIAEKLTRKGAAVQVRELTAERNNLTGQLAEWGAAPETADPKIDRIASLLSLLVPLSKDGERWVGIAMDLNAALLVELLGAFLPAIAAMLLWISRPETDAPQIVTVSVPMTRRAARKPVTAKARKLDERMLAEERLMLFVSECLRPGGETVGEAMGDAVQKWWASRFPGQPVPSANIISRVLTDSGIDKSKRAGRVRYAAALALH